TRHLAQRVSQIGIPVAHAHVNGQRHTDALQTLAQSLRLAQRQAGQRRHAAEELVVVSDFLDAFRGDAPSAQHVRQKGSDVIWPGGPAECDDEHGLEWLPHTSGDYTVWRKLKRMAVTEYRAVGGARVAPNRPSAAVADTTAMPASAVATARLVSLDV